MLFLLAHLLAHLAPLANSLTEKRPTVSRTLPIPWTIVWMDLTDHIMAMSPSTKSQLLLLEKVNLKLEVWLRSQLLSGHGVVVLLIQPIFTTLQMPVIQLGCWLDRVLPVAVDFVRSQSSIRFLLAVVPKQCASTFVTLALRVHAVEEIGMMLTT